MAAFLEKLNRNNTNPGKHVKSWQASFGAGSKLKLEQVRLPGHAGGRLPWLGTRTELRKVHRNL